MRAWLTLILAGCLEVIWAVGLKQFAGFERPWASTLTVLAMVASVALLGVALRDLPLGTAYASWVGIGVLGTFLVGVLAHGEPVSWQRCVCVVVLLVAVVGLELTTPAADPSDPARSDAPSRP